MWISQELADLQHAEMMKILKKIATQSVQIFFGRTCINSVQKGESIICEWGQFRHFHTAYQFRCLHVLYLMNCKTVGTIGGVCYAFK